MPYGAPLGVKVFGGDPEHGGEHPPVRQNTPLSRAVPRNALDAWHAAYTWRNALTGWGSPVERLIFSTFRSAWCGGEVVTKYSVRLDKD